MAKAKELPSKQRLLEVFEYTNGRLVFRRRHSGGFKSQRDCNIWNTRYSGKIAGTVDKDGRLVIRVDGTTYYAHRLIWRLCISEIVPDIIDHINNDPLDNAVANLRAANTSENAANSKNRGRKLGSQQGMPRGVFAIGARFRAYLCKNGRTKHLGYFTSAEEAKAVRDGAALAAHHEFARV